MSAIDDFGCDAADCQRDAAELVETDDGARVLLCPRCHQQAYDAEQTVTLANGRALAWDMATGWYVLPEGCDGMNDTDTTDHAAAIARIANTFNNRGRNAQLRVASIIDRANTMQAERDALAEALAEAEARAARLRRYGLAWEDDFREQFVTKELNDSHLQDFVELTIEQMRGEHLHHGDLDPEATP